MSCFPLPISVLKLYLRIYIETFGELISKTGWGAPLPEIDQEYLGNKFNLSDPGTGKWIFEEVGFTEWRESSASRLLWLCGGPGTGKTMLVKCAAAKFLKGLHNPSNRFKLVFHFVTPKLFTDVASADEAELLRHTLAKVASDLLYVLLKQDESLFGGCKAELAKQEDRFFNNPHSLWRVLREAVSICEVDHVYVLVDGIDGLKESLCRELIKRILELGEIPKVKILLSSRDVPHVSNNLPRGPLEYTKINLDSNDLVREDVETFINKRVDSWGWGSDREKRAKETLLAKSEGTFLWAALAIENLTDFSSGIDLDILEKLPPKLDGVYQKILRTLLQRERPEKVLNMIQNVALALRPLKVCELRSILEGNEEGVTAEEVPSHEETSSNIEDEIRMYVQSAHGFLRAKGETISMVHHTAVEYLFNEKRKDDLRAFSKGKADFKISRKCFQYLHDTWADSRETADGDAIRNYHKSQGSSSEREHQKGELGGTPQEVARKDPRGALVKWPYLEYAAESWFVHARRSIEISKDIWDDSAHDWLQYQFFGTSDIIRKPWIELCGDSRMQVLAEEQTPLHIAVCLGLMPLVQEALLRFKEPQGKSNQRSPLHLAAKLMSGAYKILIPRGGRWLLTDPDQDGNTPLHQAVIYGSWSMLKCLVEWFTEHSEYSKEINKKNHSGNTPLHLAVKFDHLDIFELLVENGADQSIENKDQMTASELGAELGRADSWRIQKEAEETRLQTEKEIVKTVGNPVEEPGEKPAEKPAEKPVEECVLEPVGRSGEVPIEGPVGESGREPAGETAREPVREAEGEPVGKAEGEPIEQLIQEPAGETEGDPVRETEGETERKIIEEPAGEIKEESVGETEGECAEQPVEKPAEETIGELISELMREPAREAEGESVGETEGEPVGQLVEEPVEETEGDPVRETEGETEREIIGEPAGEIKRESVGETEGEPVAKHVEELAEETVGKPRGKREKNRAGRAGGKRERGHEGKSAGKRKKKHAEEPVRKSERKLEEPEKSPWRRLGALGGKLLRRLCGGSRGGHRKPPGKAQEGNIGEGGRRNRSRDGQHRGKAARSHH